MEDSTTVKDALSQFYATNSFTTEALSKSWNMLRVGFISIPFPNLKLRREAIYLHDLTHMLTGYDTSWVGEGEVAAWELASGFSRKYWIGWVYPPFTFTVGLFLAPCKVFKAYKRGWRKMNLYKMDLPKEVIEKMTLFELKQKLDLV